MNNLVKFWPIILSAVGVVSAFAVQHNEIAGLKEATKAHELKFQAWHEVDKRQVRIDERTKAIKERQEEQQQMLQTILEKLND